MILLVLAGCLGLGGSDEPEEPGGGQGGGRPPGGGGSVPATGAAQAVASAPIALDRASNARIELLSVDRGELDTVTVRFRMVNKGEESVRLSGYLTATGSYTNTVDGTTLVDLVTNQRYFPLVGSDDTCLCSNTKETEIEPGGSHEMYALFPAPPAEVNTITVAVPMTPAFIGVPIGDGPPPPVPGGVDPTQVQLGEPKILPLINLVEGDEQSIDEHGDEQQVRLSSDVLFALNKANITAKAKSILTDVAKRIDASDDTVEIDGHTDNTGNDAINEPLSRRRAQAVERELTGLVTRQGITYQSRGYGSRDPIADIGTAAGRQKNRRVTVTFTRPKPPPQPPEPTEPPAPAAPAPSLAEGEPLATAQPQEEELQQVEVVVDSLTRDPTGMVQLTWTLTNTGAERYQAAGFRTDAGESHPYQGGVTPGVTLYDASGGLRYRTLRDEENYCVCTIGSFATTHFEQGEGATYFNTFNVPPETTSVAVEIPGYAAIKDVPIS